MCRCSVQSRSFIRWMLHLDHARAPAELAAVVNLPGLGGFREGRRGWAVQAISVRRPVLSVRSLFVPRPFAGDRASVRRARQASSVGRGQDIPCRRRVALRTDPRSQSWLTARRSPGRRPTRAGASRCGSGSAPRLRRSKRSWPRQSGTAVPPARSGRSGSAELRQLLAQPAVQASHTGVFARCLRGCVVSGELVGEVVGEVPLCLTRSSLSVWTMPIRSAASTGSQMFEPSDTHPFSRGPSLTKTSPERLT
jgi:hypothetical protein